MFLPRIAQFENFIQLIVFSINATIDIKNMPETLNVSQAFIICVIVFYC